MKILVTGAKGMLGRQVVEDLERGYTEIGRVPEEVKNAEVIGTDSQTLDITDKNKTNLFVGEVSPDVIINCAAYTNVDGCETDGESAYKVNALGVRNLAMAAEKVGAKLIHISTDYVFSGTGNTPKREYDTVRPASVYGKTKYQGEVFARQYCKRLFIVRTSWLYGYRGKNFVKTMLWLAKEKGGASVVNDQIGNPTNAADLSHHLIKLCASEEYGVYHCTGNGECSWFEFAREIVRLGGFDPEFIQPCTTREYAEKFSVPTKRPEYSSLDNMMLRMTVGDEMRPWQLALESYFKNRK